MKRQVNPSLIDGSLQKNITRVEQLSVASVVMFHQKLELFFPSQRHTLTLILYPSAMEPF
jgi:hypothetical protein